MIIGDGRFIYWNTSVDFGGKLLYDYLTDKKPRVGLYDED
jgi:hypothetical protein